MLEIIVIATAELVGGAEGATWSAEWSFTLEKQQLVGSIKVMSEENANVHFTLLATAPWIHNQWVNGGFDFQLKLPGGGGSVDHILGQPIWVLNGNNWLVPPLSMGSSGAGFLEFSWYPPADKYVPKGILNVEANWQQSPNMTVKFVSTTSTKSWDLNGDGGVGVSDLLLLLCKWENPWTVADLLGLLSAWTE